MEEPFGGPRHPAERFLTLLLLVPPELPEASGVYMPDQSIRFHLSTLADPKHNVQTLIETSDGTVEVTQRPG